MANNNWCASAAALATRTCRKWLSTAAAAAATMSYKLISIESVSEWQLRTHASAARSPTTAGRRSGVASALFRSPIVRDTSFIFCSPFVFALRAVRRPLRRLSSQPSEQRWMSAAEASAIDVSEMRSGGRWICVRISALTFPLAARFAQRLSSARRRREPNENSYSSRRISPKRPRGNPAFLFPISHRPF